jgi:hypothetical protein
LGALRNIASVDNTVAKEYYTRNIMEPLSALLPQVKKKEMLLVKHVDFFFFFFVKCH